MNRALRSVVVSVTAPDKRQRDGSNRPSGFLITAASEIMAILSLASGARGSAGAAGADHRWSEPEW